MSEPQNTSTTMLAERVRRGQSSTAAREKTRLIMEAVKPTHAMLITTNSGPDTDVCVSSSWESPCAAGEKGCGDLEANMGDWAPWLGTLRDRERGGALGAQSRARGGRGGSAQCFCPEAGGPIKAVELVNGLRHSYEALLFKVVQL